MAVLFIYTISVSIICVHEEVRVGERPSGLKCYFQSQRVSSSNLARCLVGLSGPTLLQGSW